MIRNRLIQVYKTLIVEAIGKDLGLQYDNSPVDETIEVVEQHFEQFLKYSRADPHRH